MTASGRWLFELRAVTSDPPSLAVPRQIEDIDTALMGQVATGDAAAFERLARRHARRALAVAQRITGNASEAEDLVQEALVRIWTNAHHFDAARGRFATWFYRILTNLCLDQLRRGSVAELGDGDQPIDPAPGPHAQLEGRRIALAIGAAIASLPVRQRVAVSLCYYEDMSCAEAAKVLGVSVAAMEGLLVRGRRVLREKLRTFAEGDFGNASR
jgi:RNA polymerase sigma-70 factor (ECF subfamily)